MKLIILDRDGVINRDSDEFIKNEDEWEALPGSLEAIAKLHQAGYRIIVTSTGKGQPDPGCRRIADRSVNL